MDELHDRQMYSECPVIMLIVGERYLKIRIMSGYSDLFLLHIAKNNALLMQFLSVSLATIQFSQIDITFLESRDNVFIYSFLGITYHLA